MVKQLALILSIVLTASTLQAAPRTPGDYEVKLRVGDTKRDYRMHIPPCYDGTTQLPVILAFHGMSANAKLLQRLIELDKTADKYGFITVYPNGTGLGPLKGFKAGAAEGRSEQRKADDICFVHAILNRLQRTHCIDSRRVYATGLSNGAMMCYRLAAEMPHRIAAIAPISGALGTKVCIPSRPVSVLHFHGTSDNVLPFDGPRDGILFPQTYYPVPKTICLFARASGCVGPEEVQTIDCVSDDTKVCIRTRTDCEQGTEVVLVQISGGGHQWPMHPIPLRYLGTATKEVDANEMMACFFLRHPLADCYCETDGIGDVGVQAP